MNKLSTRIGILALGLTFLVSVLIASGCSSGNDVAPSQKDNFNAPITKKKGNPGPLGNTE